MAAEPAPGRPRLTGMNAAFSHLSAPAARWRAAAGAVLIASACAVLAACSGASSPSASSAGGQGRSLAGPGAAARPGAQSQPAGGAGPESRGARLTGVRSRAIVYTAALTIRSANVSRAAGLAGRIASAAGGYVASENAAAGQGRRSGPLVRLQLKVPAAAYPRVLAALSGGRLGSRVSLARHARDVTQAVADTGSRVASARAAITQLRALLRRAGSVSSLLAVQDQINTEESSLEALQARQRALGRETSYATVSLVLEARQAAAARHHRAGGFTAGLAAGWHALLAALRAVLTGLGAVLPFAVPLAAAGLLGYLLRRWLRRRARPGATAAG